MIYFIACESFVKIGFSNKRIEDRIADLSTGNPFQMRLLLVLPGEISDEKTWHEEFASLRTRGEWFELRDALKERIERHIAEEQAKPKQADVVPLPRTSGYLDGYKAVIEYVHKATGITYGYDAMRMIIYRDQALRDSRSWFNGIPRIPIVAMDDWIARSSGRSRFAK